MKWWKEQQQFYVIEKLIAVISDKNSNSSGKWWK